MTVLGSISHIHALSGFVVGFLVGMTGVGGGSLMTPILILMFGISTAKAVGADLLYVRLTKFVGVAIHGLNCTVEWRVVLRLCLGSIPASIVTILLLNHLDLQGAVGNALFAAAPRRRGPGATALILIYPDLLASKIAGSDIVHAVQLTLVAGLGHLYLGTADFVQLVSLLLGPGPRSLPGILIDSYLVIRIPERVVRILLAAVLPWSRSG